jgi:hypothetical protein
MRPTAGLSRLMEPFSSEWYGADSQRLLGALRIFAESAALTGPASSSYRWLVLTFNRW